MGGKPLMAIAVLGWPVENIPVELAKKVIDGGRTICVEAGIPLAGGHSIDSPEPIFGLAVTGIAQKSNLKKNNTAREGDLLYLTKPLGVGMISTAQKRGVALDDDVKEAVKWMTELNEVGFEFGKLEYVTAMTDVTGFGLLGHLLEVCEGSGLSAEINYANVPLIKNLQHYVSKFIYPDNTMRNWQSYEKKVDGIGSDSLLTLCDPQTSGGLLVCVTERERSLFEDTAKSMDLELEPIGRLIKQAEKAVYVR
jgi:selenide,water dikinase